MYGDDARDYRGGMPPIPALRGQIHRVLGDSIQALAMRKARAEAETAEILLLMAKKRLEIEALSDAQRAEFDRAYAEYADMIRCKGPMLC